MRRKINLLIILMLTVFILALALVACSNANKDKAPDTIGDSFVDIEEKAKETDDTLMLRFYFTKYMSSLFTKIPINDFDIADIKFQVVYASSGDPVSSELYSLTADLVDEDCRKYLRQPGKNTIKVTLPLGEGVAPAKGSFTLNLAAESEQLEFVTLSFALNGGQAYFGTTENGVVSIEVQKGAKYTWDEFEREFVIKKANNVINGIQSGNEVFGPSSTNPITFKLTKNYDVLWRDNRITVKFDLNLPKDAIIVDPSLDERIKAEVADQHPVMNSDIIVRPDAELLNSYHGYYFAGWRDKSDGKLWLFTQTVGREDIELVAQWTPRYYSLKIYTMGGSFVTNPSCSFQDKTDAELEAEGYIFVESDIVFDLTTGDVNEINFNGLKYNIGYDKYVSRIKYKKGAEDSVLIKITDVLSVLQKGNGIFQTEGLYLDEICTLRLKSTDKVLDDEATYVNWTMPASVQDDPELISRYYLEYAFKDGISLKADGTLRIDKLYDTSVNELHIPAEIKWPDFEYVLRSKTAEPANYVASGGKFYNYNTESGEYEEAENGLYWLKDKSIFHPVSEIGDKACLNAKSLVLLDLSKATNLTRIGEHAFALCKNLTTVTLPAADKNKISDIGEQAFASTYFEDNYRAINNKDFIIINKVIYKYVGMLDENDPVLDLTTADFASNDAVYSVSAGCFADATALREITLANNIGYISNYAFRGLADLERVSADAANSKLYYAGENAFHGCDKLLSAENVNVVDTDSNGVRESVIIGTLLYRVIDKTLTSYTVGADIKSIAPKAFFGCTVLDEITFADESKIENIGKDAFIDTTWMRKADKGFTVVNGILANFYSEDYTNYDVTVPASTTRIGEYAFNSYSRYIKTIEFRAGVEQIDDYAFAGASSIKSFIFTDAVVIGSGIANVPSIAPNAFANTKGDLINGVKIYFTQAVINYLKTDSCKTNNPDWYELYRLYSSAFEEERTIGVWINPEHTESGVLVGVPKAFIKTSTDSPIASSYPRGLVIESSSGIYKYDTLDILANEVSFDASEGEHILTFTYKGTQEHCHISDAFSHVFHYKVYNGIKGLSTPDVTEPFSAEDLTSDDNYWLEGFDGDIAGREVPTFYTSHSTLDLSEVFFCYKDVFYDDSETLAENEAAGHVHKLNPTTVKGYSPTAGRSSTVTFTINFYGIGDYSVSMPYAGEKSKYVKINQKDAISIPLNGKSATYVRDTYMYLLGEDGREQKVAFNLNAFKLVDVDGIATDTLPTDEIGLHTMHVTYQTEDTKGQIDGYIVYSVVLEADNSVFSYEIVNEQKKTARITKCSNHTSPTLVLPDVYVKDGVEYTIVEIANGVFSNFTALEEVYLPSGLVKIGDAAFSGCSALVRVYTATQTAYVERQIYDENFEDIDETVVAEGTVEISGLLFTILPSTITIPETLNWTTNEKVVMNANTAQEYSYQSNVTYHATPTFKLDENGNDVVFAKFKGTLWLFDNEYNRAYAAAHLEGKDVKFYTREDNKTPTSQSRFKFAEDEFVARVVNYVKEARLVRIDNLELDEAGNIVVTPSFDMPLEIVVKNKTTGAKSVIPWRHAKRVFDMPEGYELVSLTYYIDNQNGTSAEGAKFVIKNKDTGATEERLFVDYVAEEGYEIVKITSETDYVVATASELIVPDDFTANSFLYLPNTIYTIPTLKTSDSTVINNQLTVYKSGTETLVSTIYHMPDTLEYIGSNAFKNCTNLETVIFGEDSQLSDLCGLAFMECGNLKTLDLSTTKLVDLNNQTFEKCYELQHVMLPEGLVTIDDYAFYECNELLTVNIPSTVVSIGHRVFSKCYKLTEITIPDGIEYVHPLAFNKCYDIATVTMPDWMMAYAESFKDTAWYKNLTVDNTDATVLYRGNVAIGVKEGVDKATVTTISLKIGTVGIGTDAFADCTALTSVTIPNTVISIADGAFSGCTALTAISIPSSVKHIDEAAFTGCTNIATVNMPNELYSYVNAFEGTAWYAALPKTTVGKVKYVGNVAVGIEFNDTPPTEIVLREGTVAIAKNAFADINYLKSITLPTSVKSIGDGAFSGCRSLTSINIPTSVTRIGKNSFNGCVKLASINYSGTQAEWNSVAKGGRWDAFVGVVNKATTTYQKDYRVICSDGEIAVQVAL